MFVIARHILARLQTALSDRPVVILHGARQTGKSTLAKATQSKRRHAEYLSLDDAGVLFAARQDPTGFIKGIAGDVVLDEIQRAPELFLAIKAEVDRNRRAGRFLLTGSADALVVPRLADALVGRVEIVPLWPLSQGEIDRVPEDFVDAIFSPKWSARRVNAEGDWIDRVVRGGFPEVVTLVRPARRGDWYRDYITTLLQRDVRDLALVEDLVGVPRLLTLLAARVCGLLNSAELSRDLAIPYTTLRRYMGLLSATFAVRMLPAWSSNLGLRLVKSPKVYLSDTGLCSSLLGVNAERLRSDRPLAGRLLENLVIMELTKQGTFSKTQPQMFHFRTQAGQEVDVVLENRSGEIVGVEVKASATPRPDDFEGLRALKEKCGKRFVRGVMLYAGREHLPFGESISAVPLNRLWTGAE